jgi:hypothetical protein
VGHGAFLSTFCTKMESSYRMSIGRRQRAAGR